MGMIRITFTIWFGKFLVKTMKLLGKGAGNAPGLILWTLNKDCLKAFKVDHELPQPYLPVLKG